MPFVPYSTTRKAEVVALARLVGAEETSRRTGIKITTIRRWSEAAGVGPEIDPDTLAAAADLALAKVADEIATGQLTGTKLAVTAGILQDKVRLRNRDLPPKAKDDSAIAARDTFDDWVVEHFLATALPDRPTDADHKTALDVLDALHGELLRRANTEPGQPRRRAMLAWHSGLATWPEERGEPIVAGDVLSWAQGHVRAIIADHPDLLSWHARREAELESERAAMYAEADRLRVRGNEGRDS